MQCNFRPLLLPLDSWCHGLWVPLQNCFLWMHLLIDSVKKPAHHKTDPEGLQWVQGRVGAPSWWKAADGAGGAQPAEKEAQEGPFPSLQLPERRLQPGGVGFSDPVTSDRTRGNNLELCWRSLDWILGKISSLKGGWDIGRDCPGQCGVTIPGGIPRHLNGGPGDMLAVGLAVLNDLRGLFQPEWFYSSKHFFQEGKERILAFD